MPKRTRSTMKILALDLGTHCGFALSENNISGIWDLSVKRDESRGMRLVRLRNKLNEIGAVDLVVFEVSKNHMSSLGAEVAGELRGLVTTWCIDKGINYEGINFATIKKYATGKGNANKEMMIKAAKKIKANIADDNEADAICLLSYAIKEYGG